MGSVKDLEIIKNASENEMGEGIFSFSDRYSVFDYGKMPDEIEGKGAALCIMGAYNFKELKKIGIKSHYIGSPKDNEMKVNIVRKVEPENLNADITNCMVPLEIIFRDYLPEGSSVFKRVARGDTSWTDLGLEQTPNPGDKMEIPIIDYSTKFEDIDRYFRNLNEVISYANMGEDRINKVMEYALKINDWLRQKGAALGWNHLDGKIEMALNPQGELILIDIFGTLDEDRFEYKNVKLSKQFLRNYYKKSDWYKELEEAKDNKVPKADWPKPDHLPKELVDFVSNMYKTSANVWTGENHFDVKSLDTIVTEDYKALKKEGLI